MITSGPTEAEKFIDTVLYGEPRLAAFDCDGTLWSGDSGEGFFRWELGRGIIAPEKSKLIQSRYADYKAGKVSEDDMCGEMVTLHGGLREADVQQLAAEFFADQFVPRIFPAMLELVHRLEASGCEIWAVSSTNEWVIQAAAKYFGIPENNLLAASVEVDGGIVTDRLVQVPSGPGKAHAIRKFVRRTPDAVFGNSRWDVDMMELARQAYAVNPNPDLEEIARHRKWTIYFPDAPPAKA